MKVIVHPTDQIVEINGGLQARVWEGRTESGIEVTMLVPRIAALKSEDLAEFERELKEQPAPSTAFAGRPRAFPLRMIL